MKFNKQQRKKVRNKTLPENSETETTPKRVCIRFMDSASVALSWQKDKNTEITQSIT